MDEIIIEIFNRCGNWRKTKTELKKLGYEPDKQYVYDLVNNIDYKDKIASCGYEKKFRHFSFGYEFCKQNCACSIEQSRAKAKTTMVDRYGVEHAAKHQQFKDKTVKTNLDRYGVSHPMQLAETKDKARETNQARRQVNYPMQCLKVKDTLMCNNIKKYGVPHTLSETTIRKSISKTNQERYGGFSPFANNDVREKAKQTLITRYGADNPLAIQEFKLKAEKTTFDRYGHTCFLTTADAKTKAKKVQEERFGGSSFLMPEVRKKSLKTIQDRYGVNYSSQKHMSVDTIAILNDHERFSEFLKDKSTKIAADILGVSETTVNNARLKYNLKLGASSYENEIAAFLDQHDISYQRNRRKPLNNIYEIDFYIPEHSLAIEFNGLYWHSTHIIKDNKYHLKKYEACQQAGIQLMMINEDEWIDHNSAWKNRILNLLGKSVRGNGARKHIIKVINQQMANTFLTRNHIQGEARAITYALGSYDGDALVAVMAFGKQRITGKTELSRFCTDGRSYAGVFSKMLSRSIADNHFEEIITFSDLRYSSGNVYLRNGFTFDKKIAIDYRYVYRGKTYHKSSFTKDKITKRFGIDMTNMTERQAMESLGIARIYDCGKLRFILKCQS